MSKKDIVDFVKPILESDVKNMISGDITKKKYDELMLVLLDRFNYVVRTAMIIMERKLDWYDFDNEGGEYAPGYFDPQNYSENMSLTGVFDGQNDNLYPDYIPTAWLSQDFETELKAEFEKYKKEQKQENEKQKVAKDKSFEKHKELKANIRSKLTKEELNIITFKKP